MADRDIMKMTMKRIMTMRKEKMNMEMVIIRLPAIMITRTRAKTMKIMMRRMKTRIISSLIPDMKRMRTMTTIITGNAGAETMNTNLQGGEDLLTVDNPRKGIIRAAAADLLPWIATG